MGFSYKMIQVVFVYISWHWYLTFIPSRNGILTEELECQLTTTVEPKKEDDSDSDLDLD